MSEATLATPPDPVSRLAQDLQRWDGSAGSANPLREQVAALAAHAPPRRKPANAAERAVLLAISCCEKRTPPPAQRLDGEVGALFAPFVGAPQLGAWAFDAPLAIGDDEAMQWLPIVGAHGLVTPASLAFVTTMLGARRRELWVPAARALAAMGRRDAAALKALGEICAAAPEKQPRHSPASPRHAHVVAAAFLARGGAPEALGGLTAQTLARRPLPAHDASDASAALLALLELLEGDATAAVALAALPARIAETGADELQEAVLRRIAAHARVRATPVLREQALRLLAQPRWQECAGLTRADALWSWLLTARELQQQGETALVASMEQAAGPASVALRLRLHGELSGADDAVAFALPRLRVLLDGDVRETTDAARLSLALVELLVLFEVRAAELGTLPWRALVRRAAGTGAAQVAQDGKVADVARADLAMLLARNDAAVAVLLRAERLPRSVVLQLARADNGFIARQVAVQAERLLREAGGAEAQLELLLALFDCEPPQDIFSELLLTLRGSGSALHGVVQAMARLHAQRGKLCRIESAMAGLSSAARALVAGAPGAARLPDAVLITRLSEFAKREREQGSTDRRHPRQQLTEVLVQLFGTGTPPETIGEKSRATLETAVGALHPHADPRLDEAAELARLLLLPHAASQTLLLPDVLADATHHGLAVLHARAPEQRATRDALRAFYVGTGEGRGLARLTPHPAAIEEAFARLEAALEVVADAAPALTAAQCDELEAAVRQMAGAAQPLSWPLRDVQRAILEELDRLVATCRERSWRTAAARERFEQARERGDEAALRAMARDGDVLAALPSEDVRELHETLLSRLLLRDARALRQRLHKSGASDPDRGRVQLDSVVYNLRERLAAAAGGVFLVMEHGHEWIKEDHHWGVPVLALLATFGWTLWDLSTRVRRPGRRGSFDHLLVLAARAAPLFAALFVVSTSTAVVGAFTAKNGHEEIKALGLFAWSCIGLFFGIMVEGVLHLRKHASE